MPQHRADQITARASVSPVMTAAGASTPTRPRPRPILRSTPQISVVIPTYNRAGLLEGCLSSFLTQTLSHDAYEVVVVDDGSSDRTPQVVKDYSSALNLAYVPQSHAGRSSAKNRGLMAARGGLVLFFDDDNAATEGLLEEMVRTHRDRPDSHVAVLGYLTWAPGLTITPLMQLVTEIDGCLLGYRFVPEDTPLDFTHFWSGCISCKRDFLLRGGIHDPGLRDTEDIELAYRLSKAGLGVFFNRRAAAYLCRAVTFAGFCERCERKGEAAAQLHALHPDRSLERRWLETIPGTGDLHRLREAPERWDMIRPALAGMLRRVGELEGTARQDELFDAYRQAFQAFSLRGLARGVRAHRRHAARPTRGRRRLRASAPPLLSIVMPAWNETPDLARMTVHNLERIAHVAEVRCEVLVVDNGSRARAAYPATRVITFPINRGVARAWNAGAARARGSVLCFINSDVYVQRGWDRALCQAALDGRRIAFPYTDLDDGRGPAPSDPAGLAGWCFALSRSVWAEVGHFDEMFSPAFFEDTDYFHRAWALGVELTPVPGARVNHIPRHQAIYQPLVPHAPSAKTPRLEWLFTSHRLKYGWKHDVAPDAAPPFYLRQVAEYEKGRVRTGSAPRGAAAPRKVCYLTIDDGPSEDMSGKVDLLVSRGIPAVWFCRGDHMERRPAEVVYAIERGFLIGNHSYSHPSFSDLTLTDAYEEIERTDRLIDALYRRARRTRPAKSFRFPYGDKGESTSSHLMTPGHGVGTRRSDRLQAVLRGLGYTQPRFPRITYCYYHNARLGDDVDWYWTYAVLEFDLSQTPRLFGLDTLNKVLQRMQHNDPERGLGLRDTASEDIVLLHDHAETTSVFGPIVDGLLDIGIHFARIPLA